MLGQWSHSIWCYNGGYMSLQIHKTQQDIRLSISTKVSRSPFSLNLHPPSHHKSDIFWSTQAFWVPTCQWLWGRHLIIIPPGTWEMAITVSYPGTSFQKAVVTMPSMLLVVTKRPAKSTSEWNFPLPLKPSTELIFTSRSWHPRSQAHFIPWLISVTKHALIKRVKMPIITLATEHAVHLSHIIPSP